MAVNSHLIRPGRAAAGPARRRKDWPLDASNGPILMPCGGTYPAKAGLMLPTM